MSERSTITDATIFAPASSVPEGIQKGDALTVTVGETIFTGTYGGASKPSSYNGKTQVLSGFDELSRIELGENTVLAIKGGTLSGSTVSNAGAAATLTGVGSQLYVDGVLYHNNMADGTTTTKNGGAINIGYSNDAGYVNVSGSTFSANSATRGGAIMLNYGSLDISNSFFFSNSSLSQQGGAIGTGSSAGAMTIKKAWFDGNTSATYAGAIELQGAEGTESIISGSTFTGNIASTYGGAVSISTSGAVSISNSTFTGNRASTYGGAVYISTNGTVSISNSLFAKNEVGGLTTSRGGALYITKGVVNIDGSTFSGNTTHGSHGGAIYVGGGTTTITGTTFTGNEAAVSNTYGGAIYCTGTNTKLTIGDGTVFADNTAKGSGKTLGIFGGACTITGDVKFLSGGNIYISSTTGAKLTFDNATVSLNMAIQSKNASAISVIDTALVFNNTSAFSVVGLWDFQGKNNVTFAGNTVTFNKYDDTGKNIIANAMDFTNVTITIAGNRKDGDIIAENITTIGTVKVDNAFQYAELSGTDLVVKDVAAAISSGDVQTSYTGNGLTVMDGGAVGTLFATKGDESEIATKISGGKVESNLVGGAYVAAGNTAEVDKVELLIDGTAEVAAKVYAGGYLYGNAGDAEAAAEAQMTVDEVNITLDGGAVSTNMYGGVHARQNGNASVTKVNITVTKGSHSRIYAGGWAEKGAVSSVGTSTVIISGGTVDYLYGAGANADGKTYVDTTNITVSDDAVVNTIFMGGRYGYSWVDNVNLTFAGENKELTRLSGVSSAGMDYAKATVVELETNVTADLIDYVDKFVINEGYMLTAVDEFYLGDRNNETGATEDFTTFDFIAEGEANWTAVAGISDFTNAKFSVNGSEAQLWNGESAIKIGDYELTYDATDKTIKLAQITA